MKRSRYMVFMALLSALALVAAACGGDDGGDGGPAADGDECTWEVGTLGALSGDLATIGGPIAEGIRYGVEKANEDFELGCELTLNEQDSQGAEDQAPPLAQTLVQSETLVAVVGPYFSGETAAVGPTFEDAGVPFLTPSATNPDLSANGWTNFFRLVGTDAQQGEEAATFMTEVQGLSSIVVMHDNSEYGKPLAETVASTLGDSAVTIIAINPEETDHSAELSKALDADPDGVFFGGYQPEFSELLKQGTEQGLDVVYVSGDGSKAPELSEDPSAEGSFVLCPCDDPAVSTNEEANAFAEAFESDIGEPPGTYATEGYDGVFLVATALEDGGYDADSSIEEIRTGIQEYVANTSYEGLSKTYEFDETGELGQVSIFAYETSSEGATGFEQLGLVSELAGGE